MTREQRLKQTIWETVMEGTAHCGWTDRAREGLVQSVQDAVLWADHAAPAGDDGEVREILLKVWGDLEAGCKNSMLLEKAIDLLDAALKDPGGV